MFLVAHGAAERAMIGVDAFTVPSERKAESKRRSLSIKDQAQEEAVVGHVPSLK